MNESNFVSSLKSYKNTHTAFAKSKMAAAMEIDDESAVAGADRSGNKKRFEVKKVKTRI